MVQFTSLRDKYKVLNGRQWTFDNNIVMLEEITRDVQPSNIATTHCPFWTRIYSLPMDSRSERTVRTIDCRRNMRGARRVFRWCWMG